MCFLLIQFCMAIYQTRHFYFSMQIKNVPKLPYSLKLIHAAYVFCTPFA